jgi:hypothetical protein
MRNTQTDTDRDRILNNKDLEAARQCGAQEWRIRMLGVDPARLTIARRELLLLLKAKASIDTKRSTAKQLRALESLGLVSAGASRIALSPLGFAIANELGGVP